VLKVCLLASEFAPLAKTGGLADVVAGLFRYLRSIGQDARAFLPFYSTITVDHRTLRRVEFVQNQRLEFGGRGWNWSLYSMNPPGIDHPVYLVYCPELFNRSALYTNEPDEYLRFGFFTRAVIESCQRMGWAPNVFHCNDWHTALLPLYLRSTYAWDRLFSGTRTLLTIHNIAYQGVFPAAAVDELGLGEFRSSFYQEDLQSGFINFLKTGVLYASWLSTVSRRYAKEIQTDEFGAGLQRLLRERDDHLTGIVNGVDYHEWNPENDPHIPFHYTRDDLSGKARCKEALLTTMGLAHDPKVPTLGIVSRLTAQKGFDLMFEPLPEILGAREVRLVALGNGESRYEEFFQWLQTAFPRKVCFYRGYQNQLAHMIEAGSDIFLMPSRYEPCGLNQMYSLKYGTPPVVRATGGLADTVWPWNPESRLGTGFLFDHYTAQGFRWALTQALDLWNDQESWQTLMRNGMSQDFSWEKQGREYLALYSRI